MSSASEIQPAKRGPEKRVDSARYLGAELGFFSHRGLLAGILCLKTISERADYEEKWNMQCQGSDGHNWG